MYYSRQSIRLQAWKQYHFHAEEERKEKRLAYNLMWTQVRNISQCEAEEVHCKREEKIVVFMEARTS